MCRSLVDAWSGIHDVLVHMAPDRGLSDEERARIVPNWLPVPPDWYEAVDRTNRELSALLDEIAAAPEWASTMETIAAEMSEALREQFAAIERRRREGNA
jgi:hypothetical protein